MRIFLFRFILLLSACCTEVFARDLITLVDGKQLDVVITAETVDAIEFKDPATGASQSKSADDILWVTYEDAPNEYKSGLEVLQIKKYPEAASFFMKAQKNFLQSKNDWHKDYLEFYLAYSLLMSKEANVQYLKLALTKFDNFNKTRPKSRFALPALFYVGECHLASKDYPAAKTTFEAVTKLNRPLWVARAKAGLSRVFFAEKNYDEALKICVTELQGGSNSPDIIASIIEILIEKQQNYELAYNLSSKLVCRGGADFKSSVHELKGCAAFQLKKYEEALDDLLRSSILYAKDGNESSRVNLYLFATFKALKASNSENFPDWQYKNKMAECYRKMSVADQNILKTFKF